MSVLEATKRRYVPVSVFQLFSIGIGPSSSHTVGPMRAASLFLTTLRNKHCFSQIEKITVELFGSLAMTGKGHGTDLAILLGLEGESPEKIDPNCVQERVDLISKTKRLSLFKERSIFFDPDRDLLFHKGKRFTYHSNAMRFKAFDIKGALLDSHIYYSVGGGFVVSQEQALEPIFTQEIDSSIPYPFQTAEELLSHCDQTGLTIAQIVMENEKTWRSEEEIKTGILNIWQVMQESVQRGLQQEGILPGGLNVKRRAKEIYENLTLDGTDLKDPSEIFDWVSLFALAVNEENAGGGRVVTAPTNGASGVIPAVLHYYEKFTCSPTKEGIITFFLTATAIGILYKEGASLSAAEMGCQGEVGVATSMAAAGLAAALGASSRQIENAAEIGMEHQLGLTCDPVGGLVQIPCIERNTMGAIKAINSARLATLHADGTSHRVSLDHVIAAMRHTGEDMQSKYKETSEGGLALYVPVNLPEC